MAISHNRAPRGATAHCFVQKHGVAVGIHTGGIEYTQKYLELGCNFIAMGSDSGHMMKAAVKELAEARVLKKAAESTLLKRCTLSPKGITN